MRGAIPRRRQKSAVTAESVSPLGTPSRAFHVSREVAVAELKPGLAAERRERGHEAPGLVAPSPAALLIVEAGKHVHEGVEIGRDREAEMLEVVAGIGDHHEIGRGHHAAQAEHQLGATDATGKGDNEASRRRRGRAPVHRNKSSSGGRISDPPGVAAPVQDSPRTSTTGCASSACPMMSDAALAISSANPVSRDAQLVPEQIGLARADP